MGAGEITLISTLGTAFLGLMTAVLVELIRNRKQRANVASGIATVVAEVTPNGGKSMRDAIDEIKLDLKEIRTEQSRHGARLAAVEARYSDHLRMHRAD